MIDLNRRHFLQSASLLAGCGYASSLLAGPTETKPAFALTRALTQLLCS